MTPPTPPTLSDMPVGDYAWSIEQIESFLVAHEAAILMCDGKPSVRFPPLSLCPDRDKLIAKLLPHLKSRRADLLEYLAHKFPTAFNENVQVEHFPPTEYRKAIIDRHRAEAKAAGRAVWFLKRDGRPVPESARPVVKNYSYPRKHTVRVPIDREATHVCVEGISKLWHPLPRVTTAAEDIALTKEGGLAADRRALRDRVIEPSFGLVEDFT